MAEIVTLRTTRMRWVSVAKSLAPPLLWGQLYKMLIVRDIPDADQYAPHFSPWLAPDFVQLYSRVSPYTVVDIERCWTIWQSLSQSLHVAGDVMEAGVFQGGTARLIREAIGSRTDKNFYLFDSFEGMKKVSQVDRHSEGDFADTSVEGVRAVVGSEPFIHYKKGWVPDSFIGLEDRQFCFAHIDLDLYQGVLDCLAFVYPRLSSGGSIVFDDYGFASCPGARRAVDEFFADKPERPLALKTAQALVTKL
jgi:O-methyltransferase